MKIRCLIGHKWEDAEFSYWSQIDGVWARVKESANYCKRCGRVVVPNTQYAKHFTDDPCLKIKEE